MPLAGLTVNGQIIGDKGNGSNSKNRKTYLGKVGIVNSPIDFRIEVTTEKITLQNGAAQSSFSWLDTVTVMSER